VLAVSAALVLFAAFAPAMAQTDSALQESGTGATPPPPARRPVIGINGSELPSADVPETTQQSNATADANSKKDSNAGSQVSSPMKAATPGEQSATVTEQTESKSPAGEPQSGATGDGSAQDPNTANDPNAPRFEHGPGSTAGEPAVAIPRADLKKAISILRRSTRDYAACTRVKTCSAYFDSFGVAFSFADGTIAAYSHEQRGQISGHDCVVKARTALSSGDRSMAVQWMMAAQSDILNRNWIADHPDAMLEALRTFRGWA
jgi:hypothetical protein